MKAAAAITNYNPLSVQKSYAEYLHQVNQLTACAWQIAYTALWNTQQFTAEEIAKAREFISSFIQQQQSHKLYGKLFSRANPLAFTPDAAILFSKQAMHC